MLTFPLENIWLRIITDVEPVPKYSGILDCIQKVFTNEGLQGFFNGFAWAISKALFKSAVKTLSYYLRLKTENGAAKSILYYPFSVIEETIEYAFDTLKVRSAVGLPLFSKNATGLGKLFDIYSGFSIESYSIITEVFVLKGYSMLSLMSMNELPAFIVQ